MVDFTTIIPTPGEVLVEEWRDWLTASDELLGMQGTAAPGVASAGTVDLVAGAAASAPIIEISGTTTITSFGTAAVVGTRRILRFLNAGCTITHSASLILPGGTNAISEVGTIVEALRVSSGWLVYRVSQPSTMIEGGGVAVGNYLASRRILIEERRAAGTSNGTATASLWRYREVPLSTVLDPGGFAPVSGFGFTLGVGTYDCRIRACFGNGVGGCAIRLYNATFSAPAPDSISGTGTTDTITTYNHNYWVESVFRTAVSASSVFALQYFTQFTVATVGLGSSSSILVGDEIYAQIDMFKVQ